MKLMFKKRLKKPNKPKVLASFRFNLTSKDSNALFCTGFGSDDAKNVGSMMAGFGFKDKNLANNSVEDSSLC